MKICIISKYPPIQGGISSKTFWMAKGLAEKDVEVHVVTNANCVEKEYCINDSSPVPSPWPKIYFTLPELPWHIPNSQLYLPKLLEKALEVVIDNKIDLIDTNYLIPYGIAGYLLSNMTGIPYILRHGGTDLRKFLEPGIFKNLLERVIKNAAAIITDWRNKELFSGMNANILVLPRYIPDERSFCPFSISRKVPTFAYIGKVNYYWKYKSLDKIVDVFSGVNEEHRLLWLAQGNGFSEFSKYLENQKLKRHEFKEFIHPSFMPDLLKQIDFLLYFLQDNPIKDFSNIVCEALWSGIPVITDKNMDITEYASYLGISPEQQIIKLDLDNIKSAQNQITMLIKKFVSPFRCPIKINYSYDKYIEENLSIYRKV